MLVCRGKCLRSVNQSKKQHKRTFIVSIWLCLVLHVPSRCFKICVSISTCGICLDANPRFFQHRRNRANVRDQSTRRPQEHLFTDRPNDFRTFAPDDNSQLKMVISQTTSTRCYFTLRAQNIIVKSRFSARSAPEYPRSAATARHAARDDVTQLGQRQQGQQHKGSGATLRDNPPPAPLQKPPPRRHSQQVAERAPSLGRPLAVDDGSLSRSPSRFSSAPGSPRTRC